MEINQKSFALISVLLSAFLYFFYSRLSTGGEWAIFKNFCLAVLPNLITSLLIFLALYIYLGKQVEISQAKIEQSIEYSRTYAWVQLSSEIEKIKNIQNIASKLDNSAANYSQFTMNFGDVVNDAKGLTELKTGFINTVKENQKILDDLFSKISIEKGGLEKNKLTEKLDKIIVDNSVLKNRIFTIEKIIKSLDLNETNKDLISKAKIKEEEILQLNQKISLSEQAKNQKDEEIKRLQKRVEELQDNDLFKRAIENIGREVDNTKKAK